ncbi:hypothetical protein LOK49_LG05G03585 [Camellia lanceoleosa]|uniref:Uncharacterized protein n=1 Tax=Camellia lanceoleosa TaxID=1840588 RepID=A0ACC0HPE8_9ERIC|nr:hypothetical protein LOK49_LG05G03585 [Camellia lanceoleosa]
MTRHNETARGNTSSSPTRQREQRNQPYCSIGTAKPDPRRRKSVQRLRTQRRLIPDHYLHDHHLHQRHLEIEIAIAGDQTSPALEEKM